jgi:hypothetical protein
MVPDGAALAASIEDRRKPSLDRPFYGFAL